MAMSNIFNPDNAFFSFMGKVFDIVVLNLIWLLMYVPAFGLFYLGMLCVDAGLLPLTYILVVLAAVAFVAVLAPSFIAFYYAMVKAVRRQRSYAATEFFRSFKLNFKQGIIVSVIILIIGGLLALDFSYVWEVMKARDAGEAVEGIFASNPGVFFAIFVVITYFALGTFIYLFPVLSRFSMTTKNALKFSFGLASKHVWCTVLSVLMWIATGLVIYLSSGFLVFFMVGVAFFVESLMMEKVLRKYVLQTIEEQKQKQSSEIETESSENVEEKNEEEGWKESLEDADSHDDKDEWYLE